MTCETGRPQPQEEETAAGPDTGLASPPQQVERQVLPTMVSYAQNFEDVLLRRALFDIERGFYIDIGAFHPVVDNVTQWFYSTGWSGINVEPNPRFQALLREHRPHDINLAAAVTGHSGRVRLHLMDGLSTTVQGIAARHSAGGRDAEDVIEVDAIDLNELFARHAKDRTVDFLKIDVEGAEKAILASCPFDTVRPRMLVLEATEPNSTELSMDWEADLLGKGYEFCYFDGLNRYYVRNEDRWRKALLDVPPNVFDSFLIPFTDRRVDYSRAKRLVADEAPEGGIRALIEDRDQLRRERDRLSDEIARLSNEREVLVSNLTSEREARTSELTRERDSFALEISNLVGNYVALEKQKAQHVAEIESLKRSMQSMHAAHESTVLKASRLQIKVDALSKRSIDFDRKPPVGKTANGAAQ